jgi:nicotinamidase-related amidase
MKPLLLLVDLQQDYLSSPGLDPDPGKVVQNARMLLAFCREHGIPVGHVWTTVSRNPDNRMQHWKRANVWRCEQGTPGHEPPATLAPVAGEEIIHKTGFTAPDIAALARERAVDTIIIAGVKTHACVRQVALDAWQAEFAVCIAQDAVASDDPLHAALTRRYFEARGIEFLSTADLTASLDASSSGAAASRYPPNRTPIAAARHVSEGWRATPITDRTDLVRRLAQVLSDHVEPLTALMANELGKPVRFGAQEGHNSVEMLAVWSAGRSRERSATRRGRPIG